MVFRFSFLPYICGPKIHKKSTDCMTTLTLITYMWSYEKDIDIYAMHHDLLSNLENHFALQFIDHREMDKLSPDDLAVVFIATGGVDRLIMDDFEKLPRPMLMLSDGLYNSLPTAMEMQCWFKGKGIKSEILHGDNSVIIERLITYHHNFSTLRHIWGMHIGIIGAPSPWLISAHADYLICKTRWGITCEDIPVNEVIERYKRITDDEALMIAANLSGKAEALSPTTVPDDLFKSVRLYLAILQIIETYHLDAVSVSCLRLLEKTGTAGCLVVSLLNDHGIIAGSEGDLQTLFTQILAYSLTGKKAALIIPSSINQEQNLLTMGSCNLRFKQRNEYVPSNLFRNGSGSNESLELTPGTTATLLKCGGECLDEYYLTTGELLSLPETDEKKQYPSFRMTSSVNELLEHPLGSHYTLIAGDHETELQSFLSGYGCKRI